MCGRTTLIASAELVARWLGLEVGDWTPRYNLCPGEDLLVVRLNAAEEPEVVTMRWGLVPYWAKDPRIAYQCINARADTVATKPRTGGRGAVPRPPRRGRLGEPVHLGRDAARLFLAGSWSSLGPL
jgi:putative SOS response-associated peptidase YedK